MVSHFIWLYERSNLLFFTLMALLYKTITSPRFYWETGNFGFFKQLIDLINQSLINYNIALPL